MRQGRIVYGAVPLPYALPVRGTTGRVLAERGENPIFALAKRGRVRAFPLFAFLGRTILYGREKLSYRIVKIISNPVKICSFIIFPMCFIVKNLLLFVRIFREQIPIVLIIPKSSRRSVLTIANASSTLCAEGKKALTSFAFLIIGCARLYGQSLRTDYKQIQSLIITIKNYYEEKYVSPVCRAYNLEIENAILSGSVEKNDNKTIDGNLFDTNKKANSIWQDMDTESSCGTAMGW